MSAREQEQELIIDDLTKQRNHYESELREKRREVIDLTAELDRAKREVNDLERDVEAWQEKVAYLEEELENKSILHWYLRPAFWFMAGVVVGIIVLSLII